MTLNGGKSSNNRAAVYGGSISYSYAPPAGLNTHVMTDNIAGMYGNDGSSYPSLLSSINESTFNSSLKLIPLDFTTFNHRHLAMIPRSLNGLSINGQQSGGVLSAIYVGIKDA